MSDWLTSDVKIVEREYPKGGAEAVWEALPDDRKRALASINLFARRALGLSYTGPKLGRVQRESTPQIDAALRAGMQPTEASKAFGVSRSWATAQMARLGLTYEGSRKEPPYSAAEDAILEETHGKSVKQAVMALKSAGFIRSEYGVAARRLKLKIGNTREFPGYVTHTELATLLGLARTEAIVRWTMLRNDPLRERVTGQIRRIKETDFRDWFIRNPARVDLSKMPRSSNQWLVELLTGIAPEAPQD